MCFSNLFNEEKVLGKDNWRDSTIVGILENEIYKGDFVHGKNTKHPTYYENVVEPIVSKEMWEDCQVQKKKNSRNYQRTLTYLYLQKLKCPNCNRVLGGKATTKKNGKPYFYYYCHDCKIEFRENLINEYFNQFIDELVQYDSVVNQFFLPMIRQKFEEPKEELQKEINEQKAKLDRIKKAYVNGVFKLKEYDEERKVVEKTIETLEIELNNTDCAEELRFTPKDILLKRDIDFINKIKLNKEYQERTKTWKDYSRQEQAEVIMKYVDDIELSLIGKEIVVKQINFRDSICKPCQELYENGYIDTTKPIEDYYKIDPDNKMEEYRFGIIYIDGEDEFRIEDIENIEPYFNAIPDDSETTITYKKDEPVEIVVKPVKFSEDDTK